VTSHKGIVTLKGGPMPRAEVDRTLAAVLAVPGVHEVRNYVQVSGAAPGALA
jgi:osmotically-inducible protein OsmY